MAIGSTGTLGVSGDEDAERLGGEGGEKPLQGSV